MMWRKRKRERMMVEKTKWNGLEMQSILFLEHILCERIAHSPNITKETIIVAHKKKYNWDLYQFVYIQIDCGSLMLNHIGVH